MTITGYTIYSLENIRLGRIPDYYTVVLLLVLAIESCLIMCMCAWACIYFCIFVFMPGVDCFISLFLLLCHGFLLQIKMHM